MEKRAEYGGERQAKELPKRKIVFHKNSLKVVYENIFEKFGGYEKKSVKLKKL